MKVKLMSVVLAAACLALLCTTPVRLRAATITVTNTADSGAGTLRAALAGAANGDTIDATGVSGTIALTNGQLTVSNSVSLVGPGPGTLTVSGNNASRVFEVTGTNVTIHGLKIANGQGALYGAGIRTSGRAGSVVTVSDCIVTNNSTTLLGAGIFNSPGVTLTLSNCTISGNSAPSGNAGGIYNSNATLTVIASTVSGNSAYQVAGGIMNDGYSGSATLTITASTLSSNSAWSGGGVLNYGQSGSAVLRINASTFNGNSAGYAGGSIQNTGWSGTAAAEIGDTILNAGASGGNILNDNGTVTSHGYNLCSDSGGGFFTAAGDQVNTAPLLGPLQDNGGPTLTHALLPGSPAIDQGKSDAIPALARATDQRGAARISDLPTVPDAADGSDIGAFEVQYAPAQPSYSAAWTFTTFAGVAGQGSTDGVGDNARFSWPWGIALDSAGNIYVGDFDNHTIRKITPAGVVSTLAGYAGVSGTNDGTGSAARFFNPTAVAVDSAGNVYVADTYNHTIRKITPAGVVSTIAGVAGSSGTNDGGGSTARFNYPQGITVDSAGNVYVADTGNDTIRKITPSGTVSTLAGLAGVSGPNNGTGSNARFDHPGGVAVDSAGNLYVADMENNTIRKITSAGVVSTLAASAGFNYPVGVAVDSTNNVYVADTFNYTIRKITPSGTVITLAGSAGSAGSADGTGGSARFDHPRGVAVDSAGNLYVGDTYNYTIRKITSAGVVSTLAGLATSVGSADGTGGNARFYDPQGIAVDSAGNIYVGDYLNDTIRKITPSGIVSTLAGQAGSYGSTDDTGGKARFGDPSGVAVDSAGNVYVADWGNNTIRKITPSGTVSTPAGLAGVSGTNNGSGSNARFYRPYGIAVDSATNVYVTDSSNNTIRKITPVGANWVVTTLAGLAGASGTIDGTGGDARFNDPQGIAVDSAGNLYVADGDNSTIRKITPVGTNWVVSTLAGLAGTNGSTDGTGSNARFDYPEGVAVDSAGNLYVADTFNSTIRRGVFQQYTQTNVVPYTYPPMTGQLVVTLTPPEAVQAGGQWRFPWELGWRSSGQMATNLVAGNYPIEFRDVPGYLTISTNFVVVVTKGGTTFVTNQYCPTLLGTTNTGALTVNIGPTSPSGAGWRFLGEEDWRTPGSTADNLLPDTYAIEFEPVGGYSKPASQAVQVSAGATTAVWASYLLAQSAPSGVCLPVAVPTNSINDLTDYPYGFNGQLESDVGYGSGVAVQWNVVLTAAHLVFNDQTLSYVSQVYWRFRQETGMFSPLPQAARGWYVLGGYAVQRTNDVLGGLGPDRSSPQSRNLDVAALYFPAPVAGGGCGGYLPSDAVPNPWLTGTRPKLLVGYPVDGSLFGDTNIVPGIMCQTGPQPYPLSLASDWVPGQQEVYLAPWFLSYPGNSGGPVYVQMNGYYYPAGVYLGTLYSGLTPIASLVRGIDSNVVNLITRAATLGDSGTNYTGGGVITIRAGSGSGLLAYLQVNIGPQAALDAGAAWRLQGTTAWSSGPTYTATIAAGDSVTLEFKPIAGWNVPANNTVQIALGTLTVVPATYTPNPVQMLVTPAGGLASSGYAGGPFSPVAITYTLTNAGGGALNWSASKTANWLTLNATSGTLAAGVSTNVMVSVNANANSLAPGSYSDKVGFTNLNNGLGNTAYSASLLVTGHPPVQFTGVSLLTNGAIAMTLQGVTGRVYSIVASTNLLDPLTNWAEVLRLTNTGGQTVFTNPPPPSSPQYYRVREL